MFGDDPRYRSPPPVVATGAGLALAPGPAQGGGQFEQAGRPSGPLRILVVDDNEANLAVMSRVVRALGHTPLTAQSAASGLKMALAEPPDLVLLDIVLPGMDGHEVMRLMKAAPELVGVPIVAVTALTTPGHPTRALAEGFDGYLQKPIDVDRVAQVIAHVCQR